MENSSCWFGLMPSRACCASDSIPRSMRAGSISLLFPFSMMPFLLRRFPPPSPKAVRDENHFALQSLSIAQESTSRKRRVLATEQNCAPPISDNVRSRRPRVLQGRSHLAWNRNGFFPAVAGLALAAICARARRPGNHRSAGGSSKLNSADVVSVRPPAHQLQNHRSHILVQSRIR